MKYFKKLGVVALVVLFVCSLFASPVSAKENTNCGVCVATQTWSNLNVHGGMTTMTVDNPGGSNFFYYFKNIELSYNGSSLGNHIEVGIDKGDLCSGLSYYYYAYDGKTGRAYGPYCQAVASGDINKDVTIGVSFYVSNGGGAFVWIQNTATGDDMCNSTHMCGIADSSFTTTWSQIDYNVEISDSNFTNHEVWGGHWIKNQYFSSGSIWTYWSNNSGTTTPSNPIQMKWSSPPAPGNNGGTLYSCVYPSGSNCTYGS